MSETDLFEAVKTNNVEEAKRLVASGVSIKCKDEVVLQLLYYHTSPLIC